MVTIPAEKQALGQGDLRFWRFVSASEVFLRTPMRKLLRTIPPISPKLETERSTFDLNVFVLESWRSVTGIKGFNAKSYLAMEALSKYIVRIDDILDTVNHPSVTKWNNSYRADKTARKRISGFVGSVLEMGKDSFLTPKQVREIFKVVGDYRRRFRPALELFEKLEKPGIGQILKVKEETTGGMGATMVEILNICERIPVEQKKIVAGAFSDSFMAAQIADDIYDIHDDIRNGVANIAVAVLQKNPEEFSKLLRAKSTTIRSCRKLAPKSYTEIMQIGESYLLRIPRKPERMQVLDAIPRLFYKLVQLTSRRD